MACEVRKHGLLCGDSGERMMKRLALISNTESKERKREWAAMKIGKYTRQAREYGAIDEITESTRVVRERV